MGFALSVILFLRLEDTVYVFVSKQFSAWMSQSILVILRGSVVEWSETLGMGVCLRGLVILFLVSAHVLII